MKNTNEKKYIVYLHEGTFVWQEELNYINFLKQDDAYLLELNKKFNTTLLPKSLDKTFINLAISGCIIGLNPVMSSAVVKGDNSIIVVKNKSRISKTGRKSSSQTTNSDSTKPSYYDTQTGEKFSQLFIANDCRNNKILLQQQKINKLNNQRLKLLTDTLIKNANLSFIKKEQEELNKTLILSIYESATEEMESGKNLFERNISKKLELSNFQILKRSRLEQYKKDLVFTKKLIEKFSGGQQNEEDPSLNTNKTNRVVLCVGISIAGLALLGSGFYLYKKRNHYTIRKILMQQYFEGIYKRMYNLAEIVIKVDELCKIDPIVGCEQPSEELILQLCNTFQYRASLYLQVKKEIKNLIETARNSNFKEFAEEIESMFQYFDL
jgi:hypothetical protein